MGRVHNALFTGYFRELGQTNCNVYLFLLTSPTKQTLSLIIDDSLSGLKMNENEWKWMKMNENEWKWMKMNENEWKWMKIMNENEWKWMKMNENEWMKIKKSIKRNLK